MVFHVSTAPSGQKFLNLLLFRAVPPEEELTAHEVSLFAQNTGRINCAGQAAAFHWDTDLKADRV